MITNKTLIYIKDETESRSFDRTTLLAYAVITTVKQRNRNSEIF